ncbi:MAG: hypothetical protein FJZ00_01865 [Candidatus Sericytochromatia bacterium]|uniref:Uncharacterized protein n=1 Tax=Candidatus Tanganyikabacteria bacterium TaxID=2961651 RepID=A0A937X597_9BACT|nr:hypothetical protein [Candidatus Tanganyikabacteria bacterium]
MSCPRCHGSGHVPDPVGEYGMQTVWQEIECPVCEGMADVVCSCCGEYFKRPVESTEMDCARCLAAEEAA